MQREKIEDSLCLSYIELFHFKGKGYKLVYSKAFDPDPYCYISTGVVNGEDIVKLTPIENIKSDEAQRIIDIADILYEMNDPDDYVRGSEITPDLLYYWQSYLSSPHIESRLDFINDSSASSSEKEKKIIDLLRSGLTRLLISEYSHLVQCLQTIKNIERMEESDDRDNLKDASIRSPR